MGNGTWDIGNRKWEHKTFGDGKWDIQTGPWEMGNGNGKWEMGIGNSNVR
jgi:hypothetical protein